jgi:hypothetical protein
VVLVLVSLTVAGGLNVSPGVDPNWKVSVEAAPVGTTVTFLPGVYHGCNVAVPPGSHPKPESRMSVPATAREWHSSGVGVPGQLLPHTGHDRNLCWHPRWQA